MSTTIAVIIIATCFPTLQVYDKQGFTILELKSIAGMLLNSLFN
jgi:hypothetical protein